MREELINRISLDILHEYETNWAVVQAKVAEYAVLLDDSIRNFYEMQMPSSDCPLFALCYYLESGDYGGEGLQAELDKLEARINEKFNVEIRDYGYGE